MVDELAGIFVPLGAFALVAFIVWLVMRRNQARAQMQAELQKHLLDKFSTGPELAEFLTKPEAKDLIKAMGSPQFPAQERVARTYRAGIILSTLGAGFLALTAQESDLVIPGTLLLAVGVGFLLAGFLSYRMYKGWGQFQQSERPE